MQKFLSTRFSIVSRSRGGSAIDKASYISREKLYSDYDGQIYRPKAKEDLVHSEINLCENAPAEYKDRATLWNAVEKIEKSKNAQLCRMMKASLPNDWTYEIAEEVVRKYVKENFVSKGMCADWAIHDSVNDKGQRNLHFHLLLTLRAIDENGKWMPKQKKIYILDEDGNKIRQGKNYKCRTEQVTDWNDRKWGKIWRKNLRDIINETNEALKIDEKWEHRSFKELGLEELPMIHLGSKAHALESKGIHTERGDYNRRIMDIRGAIDFIKRTSASIEAFKERAGTVINEVTDIIKSVAKRHGILQLPIVSGKYLRKVTHRERLQDAENMMRFVEKKGITTFEKLENYLDVHGAEYDRLITNIVNGDKKKEILKAKISAYQRYKGFADVVKESQSLKGIAKWKFDWKNKKMLEAHPKELERLRRFIPEGEKITVKKWNNEIAEIENNRKCIEEKLRKKVPELAYAEVLDYNKDNEERERRNEERALLRKLVRQKSKGYDFPEL